MWSSRATDPTHVQGALEPIQHRFRLAVTRFRGPGPGQVTLGSEPRYRAVRSPFDDRLGSGGIHRESLSSHDSLKVVHMLICHGLEHIDTKRARELVPVLAKGNPLLDPHLAVQSAGKDVIAEGEMVESKSPRSNLGPHAQTEVLCGRGSTAEVCDFGAVTMPLLISEVQQKLRPESADCVLRFPSRPARISTCL